MVQNLEGEIWKDVKTIPYHQAEWPFHQVSNRGRVRVLPGGKVSRGRIVIETELRRLSPRTGGYLEVVQREQKQLIHRAIHILVLNAFVGPCPAGLECRHLNGDPSDNRWPENIVWGTHVENEQDKVKHGTTNCGERNGSVKLTKLQVLEIRGKQHITQQGLAEEYGVTQSCISRILGGELWGE